MRWLRKEPTQGFSPRDVQRSSTYNDHRQVDDYGQMYPSDEEDERGDALMPLGASRTERRGRENVQAASGSGINGVPQQINAAPPPPQVSASRGAPFQQKQQPLRSSNGSSPLPTSPQRAAAAPNIWAERAGRKSTHIDPRHRHANDDNDDDDDWSDDGDKAPAKTSLSDGHHYRASRDVDSSADMYGGYNSGGQGDFLGVLSEDDDEEAAAMEAALAAVLGAPSGNDHSDLLEGSSGPRQHLPLLSSGDNGRGATNQGMFAPSTRRNPQEGPAAAPSALVAPPRPVRDTSSSSPLPGADAPAAGASAAAAARARVAARTGVMPQGGPDGTQYQLLGVKPGQRLRVRPQPRRTRA